MSNSVVSGGQGWLWFNKRTLTDEGTGRAFAGRGWSESWPQNLGYIRVHVGCGFLGLEFVVSSYVKNDLATISCNLIHQLRLIYMYTTLVGLWCFLDIHIVEHSLDTQSHSIIIQSGPSCSRLPIAGDNGDTLNRLEFRSID